MSDPEVNLSILADALKTLQDILNQPMNEYVRDGVIQRFEYTFELSWKTMQRVLKLQGVDTGSPTQVIRAAAKAGFIESADDWMEFAKSRNLVSHSYSRKTAEQVYQTARGFPAYVETLLKKLRHEINIKSS